MSSIRGVLPAPLGHREQRDLWRALGLHLLLLPVWAVWALLAAFGSPSSGGSVVWLVGAIWLAVGGLLVEWWSESRVGLVSRVLVWAVFWWAALLLFPLLFVAGFRRGFVPPPPASSGESAGGAAVREAPHSGEDGSESARLGGLRGVDILLALLAAIVVETPLALLWGNTAVNVIVIAGTFLLALLLMRQVRLHRRLR